MTAKKKRVEHYLPLLFEYVEADKQIYGFYSMQQAYYYMHSPTQQATYTHTYYYHPLISKSRCKTYTILSCQYYAESILATVKKNKEGMDKTDSNRGVDSAQFIS